MLLLWVVWWAAEQHEACVYTNAIWSRSACVYSEAMSVVDGTVTCMTTTGATFPATVDARVALTFAKRERGTTFWIEGEYPTDARPDALFEALAEIGMHLDPMGEGIPAYPAFATDGGFRRLGYDIKSFTCLGTGTALFGEMTDDEARIMKRRARTVLRRFGFQQVPTWRKTLADML